MPRDKVYQVIQEFDHSQDYPIPVSKKEAACLSILKKGQILTQKQFLDENKTKFKPFNIYQRLVCITFGTGENIGILKNIPPKFTEFEEFCKQETVAYFIRQLRGSKMKNLKEPGLSSTQKNYTYALWRFSNWLQGKDFEYSQLRQVSSDSFQRQRTKVKLEGLESFYRLYIESHNSEQDFAKVIKSYLLDPKNKDKRASTVTSEQCAIKAYFEKNDSPINFRFDSKSTHKVTDQEDDQPHLNLDDLLKMLTVGRPTLAQKAMILCKFHRGLDTSTFVDRFNFQAWEQLVEWFGTDIHTKWDLDKCPVPIKLTRIKTSFSHLGFLDRDAVTAIQDYLDIKVNKIGRLQEGEPLFVNPKGEPMSIQGLRRMFQRMAKTAGIQRKLQSYNLREKYEKDSHELRDLLKSILIDCGCRIDVADHCIGHRPKDSYEKQVELFPENIREEFRKASSKINVFSNISNNMKKSANVQVLQNEVISLREEVKRLIQKDMIRDKILPASNDDLMGLRLT
ncbi:MAG: tyrosine-type recombinase/integrase [Nitrosarchaeum sp.]